MRPALPILLGIAALGALGSAASLAATPAVCADVVCPTASLAQGRSGHTATRLADGSVLIIGGGTQFWGDLPTAAERWDPATEQFLPAGTLAEGRYGHAAVLLADGRVLVVGGYTTPEADLDIQLASAELWDPATETFTPTGSLALARAHPGAVLLDDGRVLVLGGDNGPTEMTVTTEIWDPTTGIFTPGPTMTQPRGALDAVSLGDGRVLTVGGTPDYPATSEVVDVAAGTSTPTGTVSVRGTFRTTLLDDGRVLAVGGDGSRRGTGADVWDPATGLWSTAGAPTGWYSTYHTQAGLEDGRVLIVLGRGELWDPAVGGFVPIGPDLPPAGMQTATRLSDGRVLVVGGQPGRVDQHQAFTGAAASLADAAIWDLRTVPTPAMSPAPASWRVLTPTLDRPRRPVRAGPPRARSARAPYRRRRSPTPREEPPMVRHPRAALALLIAAVLTAGVPSALVAAAPTPAATPFDRNLLRNGGFEQVGEDGTPTGWQVQGKVRVERFGDRPWPYPAYGAKYHGGQRYLGCSGASGLVRQRVAFVDRPGRSYWVKAHLQVDFGGRIHHAIRVSIRATGEGVDRVRRETKPLIITNHYKRAVTWLMIPPGTNEITATVQLVGVRNGARCRMVADTVKLILLRV